MAITANDVKTLRDRTNAPMMECKTALNETGGDMEKAIEWLRKKAGSKIGNFAARETAEGRIAVYLDPTTQTGALVEVRCETAPVSKTDQFIGLTSEIAKQIALKNPATVEALLDQTSVDQPTKKISDRIMDVFQLIRENMRPHRFVRLTGLLGEYVHHDGSVGVLLQVDGAQADPQVLRDVCMHITARNPVAATKDDVPAATLAKETEIIREQTAGDPKNKNKPANILDKIIEGKLKTWLAENVLLEQPFVKDDSKTVGQLLTASGLKFVKFVRYKVGDIS
ncbi:MAG: translation elongation factor Ts [Planctomycetes bacterium]|jgi:elongation factor Ts|nr:translation elongation factor Ts [Planctomycetota bacterium]